MPKQILNSKITSTHAVVYPISVMSLGCIYILYSEYSLVGRTAGSGWLWCNIKLYTESTYAGLMLILLLYLEVGICCPGTNKGICICYGQSCRCVQFWS